MKYNKIGLTDISISEISLGCWALGGLNWENGNISSGWTPVIESEAIDAIHYALDKGVNHFDNADVYGNGKAERLLAKALNSSSTNVTVSSKVGWFKGTANNAYEPLNIRHQCEQSLLNLKRNVIDIYYFHHGNFGKNDEYLDDAIDTFHRLKEEGKIRAIGLSTYSQKDFKRLIPKIKPSVVQSWAHIMDYHFITQNSILMNLCDEFNISFIGFSPLNQGILLNKYKSSNPPSFPDGDHRSKSEKFKPSYLKKAEKGLKETGDIFGNSTEEYARLALQFVLYHKNVAAVIPGFRNKKQVKMLLHACSRYLDGNEMAMIRKAYL